MLVRSCTWGGSFCIFPTFTLQPFFITFRPRITTDLQDVLQENKYAYFSRMSETSNQEVITGMTYQMHWAATLMAFGILGRGYILASGNIKRKKKAFKILMNILSFKKSCAEQIFLETNTIILRFLHEI